MLIAAALSFIMIPVGLELKPIERCPTYNPRLADEGCPKGGGGGVPFSSDFAKKAYERAKPDDGGEGCTGSGGGNCGNGEGQGGGNGTGNEGMGKGLKKK